MTPDDKDLRITFEMCASLCDQCNRELMNHGDIEVSSHGCGCYCHFRGLGFDTILQQSGIAATRTLPG